MKTKLFLLWMGLICIASCEKDKNDYSWSTSPKLLVAIKENNKVVTEFKYDSLNRLIQINNFYSDTISYSEFYEYDLSDRVIRRTYDGFIDTYEYNRLGRLISATSSYLQNDKVWKTEYIYSGGRIIKGIFYYGGSVAGYLEYRYDSRGNTIQRTQYAEEDPGSLILSKIKLAYDNNIIPVRNISAFPIDIVQHHNPIYYYNYSALSSSFPPEIHSEYNYDTLGVPIKEYKHLRTIYDKEDKELHVYDYEYIEKKE